MVGEGLSNADCPPSMAPKGGLELPWVFPHPFKMTFFYARFAVRAIT
jgi:hypothetical protein